MFNDNLKNWSMALAVGLLNIVALSREGRAAEIAWTQNFEAARDIAVREERFVMLFFTGSDWCPWCKRLDSEILQEDLFMSFARDYLVSVKVDFPKAPVISEQQYRANQILAQQYKVTGYPTLVFLDSDGREIHRRGYQAGGVQAYFTSLIEVLRGVADITLKRRHERVRSQLARAEVERNPPPVFGGAMLTAPQRYTNLVLKSLSGTKNRRFALLNNQTLGVGESASVQLEDKSVRVRCLEIRERSVMVQVEGESLLREVRLVDGK